MILLQNCSMKKRIATGEPVTITFIFHLLQTCSMKKRISKFGSVRAPLDLSL